MTHGILNVADTNTEDRFAITRRAELLRAEETQRLISALSKRIRNAFAAVTGRREPVEHVFIPRSPSSAIFKARKRFRNATPRPSIGRGVGVQT